MMKSKLIMGLGLSFCFCISLSLSLYAQKTEWKWGDNPQKAKESYTLVSDNIKIKDYKIVDTPLHWLLANTPDLHPNLYNKAIDYYQALITDKVNPDKEQVYKDSVLILHDVRIEQFGKEAEILNRKGYYALTYWLQKTDKYDDLYDLYEKIVKLNKDSTYALNVQYYMYLVDVMKKNNRKDLDETKVIEIYDELSGIIDTNLEKPRTADKETWQKTREYVDGLFSSIITIDCDFIERRLIPQYNAASAEEKAELAGSIIDQMVKAGCKDTLEAEFDKMSSQACQTVKDQLIPKIEGATGDEKLELINEVLGRMIRYQCTNDPKFLELSKQLYEAEPTFTRATFLYKAYLARKDYTQAYKYMEEASNMASGNKEKADVILTRAKLKQNQGQLAAARADYFQAVQLDASLAYEAYSAVAGMYLSSFQQCNGTDASNPVHKKAVAIAAYNMYQKAGNGTGAARAKQYFPTTEEVFTHSMGGKQVNVGCWIGETVTIPKVGSK